MAVAAFAQRTIQVELPTGDYALFASTGAAAGVPKDPVLSKGGTASVPLGANDDHVYALDRTSDDLAVLSAKKLPMKWSAKAADFDRLDSISVAVEQNSKPLAAGEVLIPDGDSRHSQIVDSSGPVTLFDVKAGNVSIVVRFKGADGSSQKVTEIFPIALDAPKASRTVTVAVGPTPATPTPPAQTAAAPSTAATTKPQPANPVGVAIVWLVGLGFAAFVVYFLMNHMRNNPGSVAARLEQLGVQVPKPGDHGLDPAVPISPDPIRPAPVQKIVLTDSAPDLITPVAPSIAVSQPSLVSDSGIAIPLVEGETIVGREPGLGLSLSAETTVSRRHANLVRTGQEVTLTDLGSSNGTFVNGAKLQSPTVLRTGDAVQFGSARFSYRA